MMTQPGMNIKVLHAHLFSTGSEILDGILQALNTAGEFGAAAHGLPGFSLISKYGSKILGKTAHAFHTWWSRRGRIFADIDDLSQDALLRKLPSYLGADLADALAAEQTPRLVVLLDTRSRLREEEMRRQDVQYEREESVDIAEHEQVLP